MSNNNKYNLTNNQIFVNYLLGLGLKISWLASVIHRGFNGPLRWSTPVHCSSRDPVELLPLSGDKPSQLLGDCSGCPCCWDMVDLGCHIKGNNVMLLELAQSVLRSLHVLFCVLKRMWYFSFKNFQWVFYMSYFINYRIEE